MAAVSFVPRKGAPAIFALLCRAESYRALPAPALACRYEFPQDWPGGVNLQPGDFAARELVKGGKIIINVDADEASRHTVNFRGTTGLRSSREHITRAAGEPVFLQSVAQYPACLIAAYDNVLLGCLYESLFREPFAPDSAGRPLGGSLTIDELKYALKEVRDVKQLQSLHERFQQSHRNILRMAAREGVELSIPSVLPNKVGAPLYPLNWQHYHVAGVGIPSLCLALKASSRASRLRDLRNPLVVDTGTWTFTNRYRRSPAPVLHKGCCVHTRGIDQKPLCVRWPDRR